MSADFLNWLDNELEIHDEKDALLLKELLETERTKLDKISDLEALRDQIQEYAREKESAWIVSFFDRKLQEWQLLKSKEENAQDKTNVEPEINEGIKLPISERYKSAVSDARLLISYGTRHGIALEPDAVQSVLESEHELSTGTSGMASEVAFWAAFQRLAVLVQPATVESIRESFLRGTETSSLVQRLPAWISSRLSWIKHDTTLSYRWGILFALTIVLIVHIFFSIIDGYLKQLSEIREKYDKIVLEIETDALEFQLEARRNNGAGDSTQVTASGDNVPAAASNGGSPVDKNGDKTLAAAEDSEIAAKFENLQERFERLDYKSNVAGRDLCELGNAWSSTLDLLTPWVQLGGGRIGNWWTHEPYEGGGRCDNTLNLTDITLEPGERKIREAQAQIETVSQFLLPLLYGWVGALAFILRSLSEEIRRSTLSRASSANYSLRWPLGMLAGVGIGLMMDASTLTGFAALTPLGLAFAAGYSVEVLFTFLDRIVGAFSEQKTSTTTSPGPQ